ncbi:MAG: DUF190 domain-containing protein [Bacteroidales bacterium]|jgi:hypothetical protein|nr:DUF190 domain-containing protein [Bacteroidales bacterium]NPV37477.1 DUF190 domain-containing protein [Bacteroidales bacterium]
MERMSGEAVLLRIFLGESDKFKGKLLYEAIVEAARRNGLAGATVLRGIMGYGINSTIHTFKLFALSEDMPVIIEIVDTSEKISAFMPLLNDIIDQANTGIMITTEKVQVVKYTAKK